MSFSTSVITWLLEILLSRLVRWRIIVPYVEVESDFSRGQVDWIENDISSPGDNRPVPPSDRDSSA